MENIYDSKWDRNRYLNYTGDPSLEYNRDSSGNRIADALLGFGQAAMVANPYNQPGKNYIDISYKGNGLADSRIRPIQNFSYQNPYELSEYLKSNLRKNMYRFGNYNGDLGDVNNKTNVNKILGTIGVTDFVKPTYPTSIYDDEPYVDTIYNYTEPEFVYPTYLNGGGFGDFGKTVSDYFGGI